jgi:hypothetical protein
MLQRNRFGAQAIDDSCPPRTRSAPNARPHPIRHTTTPPACERSRLGAFLLLGACHCEGTGVAHVVSRWSRSLSTGSAHTAPALGAALATRYRSPPPSTPTTASPRDRGPLRRSRDYNEMHPHRALGTRHVASSSGGPNPPPVRSGLTGACMDGPRGESGRKCVPLIPLIQISAARRPGLLQNAWSRFSPCEPERRRLPGRFA